MGLVKKVLDLFRKKEADSCLDASTREFHAGIERAAIFGTLIAACQYGYHGKGFYLLHEEMREGLETSLNKYIAGVQNKLADGTIKEERRYAKYGIKCAKDMLKALYKKPQFMIANFHGFPILIELYRTLLHPNDKKKLNDWEMRNLDRAWQCLFTASSQMPPKKKNAEHNSLRTFEDYTNLGDDDACWAKAYRMNPSVEDDIAKVCSFKLPDMVSLKKNMPALLRITAFSIDSERVELRETFTYLYPALKRMESLRDANPLSLTLREIALDRIFTWHKYKDINEISRVIDSFERLNGYTLGEELGRGGFGIAYKLINHDTGEVKTLKLLDPSEGTYKNVERLKAKKVTLTQILDDELNNVKNIQSKYIAQIDDVSFAGFMIREYFDNTLDTELKEAGGRLNDQVAKRYAAQLIEGMADSHRAGVLHRDLGLQNIGIAKGSDPKSKTDEPAPEKQIKIFDFGVNRYFDYHPGHSLVCKIDTRDPRIISGELREYDKKCDVYSIGAAVYIMVTGKLPLEYEGARNHRDIEVRKRQNAEAVESYHRKGIGGLMREMRMRTDDPFLLKLVEKSMCPPENRWEDADAVYRDLIGNRKSL